ncbi:Hypothetical protein SMAX5B_015356 [Scophthalmus maximus]|uniref:Uncharacterized protein n=1 Tax=Scophthalmus maximus TaxID=52904 RepID=A0A2U9CCF2_SCOMX|nr:Hypothetical protein SMAX5B_015356 [Scophthalmus maximus]
MKHLTQVRHSDQAVHKHLSLRPEVQLEMTLVQEHHTNLQEQIQAPQPRVEGDPEEGHTSKVSIAACTAIQEPHSVPDLEEMSSSGLTSRHLLHDALQPMEQMNPGNSTSLLGGHGCPTNKGRTPTNLQPHPLAF